MDAGFHRTSQNLAQRQTCGLNGKNRDQRAYMAQRSSESETIRLCSESMWTDTCVIDSSAETCEWSPFSDLGPASS